MHRAGPGLGDNATAETAPGGLSNAGVAATTPPPEEEPAESLIKFTFGGSVPDQQAFEELVQSELLRIKSPDSLPEAPALIAEDALSPHDTADADDDAISLPGSESSFEDFFEDAEETWVEDVASPASSVSVAAPQFHVPGGFPTDDDEDDDVASPVTTVLQGANSAVHVAGK
ncbi:hypothetical protein NLG97_g7859 [Lecanicillium saksenae]|uniref:Uncharacterized protein n=1 Tax=Lecanicillium saksenae TaxID=468837 RepID=A0ACC1QMY6_9HYPO|nr:hypothetical protein NLG97_g7859 [Lecanicillium saksenae]